MVGEGKEWERRRVGKGLGSEGKGRGRRDGLLEYYISNGISTLLQFQTDIIQAL